MSLEEKLKHMEEMSLRLNQSDKEIKASHEEIKASHKEMETSIERIEASHEKIRARLYKSGGLADKVAAETKRRKLYANFHTVQLWMHLDNIQAEAIDNIKNLYTYDKLQQLLDNQIEPAPCEELAMKDNATRQLLRDSPFAEPVPLEYDHRATGHFLIKDKWPHDLAIWLKVAKGDPHLSESMRERLPTTEALTLMASQQKDLDAVIKRKGAMMGLLDLGTVCEK